MTEPQLQSARAILFFWAWAACLGHRVARISFPDVRVFWVRVGSFALLPAVLLGVLRHPHITAAASMVTPPGVVVADSDTFDETPAKDIIEEDAEELRIVQTFDAYRTEYSRADSCHNIRDGHCLMASGKPVYEGAVACPYSLRLGTKIMIGDDVFTCEDRYARWLDRARGKPTIDVFVHDSPRGKSVVSVAVLAADTDTTD